MKIRISFLLFLAAATKECLGAAIFDVPLQFDDHSSSDWKTYQDLSRYKRGSSGDIVGIIKNGISSKLAQFAHASAGSSGHFSKGISGGHYDTGYTYAKPFDWWGVKKSILNTLFQAVKAINGGIITIKGELIKGGGHLLSAKGKLIGKKGEKISQLGRQIIGSAMLSHQTEHVEHVPYSAPAAHTAPSAPALSHDYGAPSASYGAPTGHAAPSAGYVSNHSPSHEYAGPIAPGSEYGAPISSPPSGLYIPQKFSSAYEALKGKLPAGTQAGILLLKKIPSGSLSHLPTGNGKIPSFKPLPSTSHGGDGNLQGFFESSLKEVPKHEPLSGGPYDSAPSYPHKYTHQAPVIDDTLLRNPPLKFDDSHSPSLHSEAFTKVLPHQQPHQIKPHYLANPIHGQLNPPPLGKPYGPSPDIPNLDSKPLPLDYESSFPLPNFNEDSHPPLTSFGAGAPLSSYDVPHSGTPISSPDLSPPPANLDNLHSPDIFSSTLTGDGSLTPESHANFIAGILPNSNFNLVKSVSYELPTVHGRQGH